MIKDICHSIFKYKKVGLNMEDISQVKKEIFMSMKIIDTTIKGIKESEEYKIAQAYNQGLRDAMTIFEKKLK